MIRKFQKSDMDQVIRIWLDASIQAHDFIDGEFWKSRVTDMRKIYLPSAATYIYEEERSIRGFISLYNETIAALFVAPDSQGKGIGKQLIQRAKALCDTLNLTVFKENQKSILFYKNEGFRIVQEQIDVHTGHPELIMTFNS